MNHENRPAPLPEDFSGYTEEQDSYCPKCESNNIRWAGGDNVVNLGDRPIFTRVDWWKCDDCGHKWTEYYDHD